MEKIFTTFQIAQLLKVDITTVMLWVNKGQLSAYRTPGGHRRIEQADLLAFLKKYKMPIPLEVENNQPQILIVDDDAHSVRIISRVVKKMYPDAVLKTANDGFQTGAILESFMPDLIVLDLMMEHMDGLRVCENIRKEKRFKKVKILMLTGFPIEENKKKALAAGADKFLGKSGDLAELKKVVANLLPFKG